MTVIFAHRGSKVNRPENTLASFLEAVTVGADGIELDVHRTKDNHLVVIHDERVDRTSNGIGLVRKLTLNEIKALDVGSWFSPQFFREKIPTLEEVLDLLVQLNYKGVLNIEIKTDHYPYPKIESEIAALMQSRKWPFTYIYSSFNWLSLMFMHRYNKEIELAYLMKTSPFLFFLGQKTPFVTAIHPHKSRFLSKADQIDNKQKIIRPWTLNDEEQMLMAFKAGLAGFMTDKPEVAVRLKAAQEEV
ncbi:glycerophosphodiester phosphodiesterase [Streptococcus iniae]|uniref:glycerophosphodiester phosphodiesterase n=1 Tax=Streptococcus iniae TaxID=1346 RepID=UPI000EF68AB8|nr:glycerophosphodiester phosphodiesterase [Streptococcus iniae]RLU60296.1 glycerophosphodiester phosphodiesterase [Streptococcus iniae]RLU62112.1 glycerophosphodiester phosphodiesterase [Streptococcus iniae]RLU70686.1 glycerophosphodiester phosphodiesterase [Streptococcus iniae]RLU84537.1 glycerophosphodiester phosphodiesterase [Streptococcus iniae]RLU84687.1 glycerophosphodiester phosphodiesterase [Streptococcus iniae]